MLATYEQSPMKNIFILALVVVFFFLMYRSCTEGYANYGYLVHAKNVAVFSHFLSDADPNIIRHGRKLLDEIENMDQQIDNGDGPQKGLLRWYVCSGIDCDEGWQRSFLEPPKTSTESKK